MHTEVKLLSYLLSFSHQQRERSSQPEGKNLPCPSGEIGLGGSSGGDPTAAAAIKPSPPSPVTASCSCSCPPSCSDLSCSPPDPVAATWWPLLTILRCGRRKNMEYPAGAEIQRRNMLCGQSQAVRQSTRRNYKATRVQPSAPLVF